jgi:hypothetical protein
MQRAELKKYPVKQSFEGVPYTFKSVDTVKDWKKRTIADWAAVDGAADPTFTPCSDDYRSKFQPYLKDPTWEAMKKTFGDATLTHCDNMTKYCDDRRWDQARLLCPVTCGGHSALSGQFHDIEKHGMSYMCLPKRVKETMLTASCNERTPSELAKDPGFQKYFKGIASWMMPIWYSISNKNATMMNAWHKEFIDYPNYVGCNFFKPYFFGNTKFRQYVSLVSGDKYEIDFCDMGNPFTKGKRSPRAFCPVTCGCSTSVKGYYERNNIPFDAKAAVATQCPGKCFDMPAIGRTACNTSTSSKASLPLPQGMACGTA